MLLWMTAFAGMTMGGCGAQDSAASSPEKPTIVSLNPCADAILAEIAAPGQVLAISHYSQREGASSMPLDVARRYRSTSGTAEEVIALAPDIVIADIFLAPDTRDALEAAGLRVETIGSANSLAESLGQVRDLAGWSGNVRAGAVLSGKMRVAWDAAGSDGPKTSALLWQAGGIVPGEDTLAAQMLSQAGFSLHSAARGMGQGAYLPLEAVLADPPQVLLAASDERMLSHPVLQGRADMAYHEFDPALLYCGGPTIVRALERLVDIREAQ